MPEHFEQQVRRAREVGSGAESAPNAIPEFPQFKKLELLDKAAIDSYTNEFGPYSDFVSGSVLPWNVHEDIRVSRCRGNLALMFTDYGTNEPFYTFIGNNDVNGTAEDLLRFPPKSDTRSTLKLVPEKSVEGLDRERFLVEEDPDHFDYLYDLHRHSTFEGRGIKARRNSLNKFLKNYPEHESSVFTVNDPEMKRRIADLCRVWENNNDEPVHNESAAIGRFLSHSEQFEHVAVGVEIEQELRGFIITLLTPAPTAVALFSKADIRYEGINSMLMRENARMLLERGYTQLNYEQDLGIENLRRSKRSFDPSGFLKKYRVSHL